jgi:hypothetical protein
VTCGDQIAVPAQHGFGADHKSDPTQHVAAESVQQGGQQCPVGRGELELLAVQLPFEDHDLVSQARIPRPWPGHSSAGIAASPACWPRRGTPVEQYGTASSPNGRHRCDAHWTIAPAEIASS